MSVPLCCYLKSDGTPCGSPALRGKPLCYFHLRDHQRQSYAVKFADKLDVLGPRLPLLRDHRALRDAIQQIVSALGQGIIDPELAGRHLFAIQQRSVALDKRRENQRTNRLF